MNNLSNTKNINMGIIIFDLDGTLINSMPAQMEVFSDVLQEVFSIPKEESQEEYLRTAGQPLDDQFAKSILRHGHKIENGQIYELMNKFWNYLELREFELFPSVLQAISEIKKAGYLLVISSGSSPMVVNKKLRNAKIAEYFSVVLGSDYENKILIKGVEHLDYIKNRLGIPNALFKKSTLMVGDGIHDIEIAQEGDLKSIGIVSHRNKDELIKAGADLVINNLNELLNVLTGADGKSFIPISQLNLRLPTYPQ